MFPQLLKKYGTIDIIGGKIADDQTAHTLQQYIGGVDFGIPGTPKADKIAIEKLLPNRDTMSYEDALLRFINSKVYKTLFDYDTGIWRESPDYLLNLYDYCNSKKTA